MGRSVSYASGSAWVLYTHLDFDPGCIFECRRCDHEHERDDDTEPAECEACGNIGFRCRERYPAELVWDDFVGNLRAEFKAAFRSLRDCDEWVGREDHAILRNRLCYIGVSEYCGLVSVWCKPHVEYRFYDNDPEPSFAETWAAQIRPRAERLLESFAERLVRVGTFSNGEGVYRRAG